MMIPLSRLPSDHLSKEALMARRSKAKGTRQRTKLHIIYTRAAGIDVGSTFHVVAVPPELSAEPVQTFQSFTGDLYRLAHWLVDLGVTTVAMESTGIYWIPVFDILEAHGLEVLLVNAQHVQTVPGRKTDVNDAQWIHRASAFSN
jgi:transposase